MSQPANSDAPGPGGPLTPINVRIATAERELQSLYRERAGQMEPGRDWAWCSQCGRHHVSPLAGEDTCHDCVGALAGATGSST